jgi:hypothetical protein
VSSSAADSGERKRPVTNAMPISTGPGATILKASREIVTGGTGFGDFPTIAGTFDTTSGGFADVFVAKFARAN